MSRPVFVLTSIARPSRFYRMLDAKGLNIKGELAFRDHHRYSSQDVTTIRLAAEHCGAEAVVTTAKDRVRLAGWPRELPLYVAGLSLDFVPDRMIREKLGEWVGKAMKVNEK